MNLHLRSCGNMSRIFAMKGVESPPWPHRSLVESVRVWPDKAGGWIGSLKSLRRTSQAEFSSSVRMLHSDIRPAGRVRRTRDPEEGMQYMDRYSSSESFQPHW